VYLRDRKAINEFLTHTLEQLRAGKEVESFVCGIKYKGRDEVADYYWSDKDDVLRVAGMCTRVIHFVHDYIDECNYWGVNSLD